MRDTTYPPLGTVSQNGLNEDLIPEFMAILRLYAPGRSAELAEGEPQPMENGDYPDQEAGSEFCNLLIEELDAIAAPYSHFGANEGDGDYGFWPDIDTLEQDARYENGVVKLAAGTEWRYHNGYIVSFPSNEQDAPYVHPASQVGVVMLVSDHGNVTLYDAMSGKEIWSIV